MKKKKIGIASIIVSAIFLFNSFSVIPVFAENTPEIKAVSATMIDRATGKILYTKDADKKMFPASTTKILTAIVALEYLKPDEIVVAGNEVGFVPIDSSKAGIKSGESIRVDNLIRGLIIPSGNEAANVVAMEVARRVSKDKDLGYAEAEKIFANLMNEKAKSLGATNSNFVNPHGYHDDNHYTTAHDMALISQEAMKNPLISEIAKEKEFIGNGAGENPDPNTLTQEYKWKTHNELLVPGDYYYSYADGIKTGFTDEAGSSVVASATKDGKQFVSVIYFSPDPDRWFDAIKLFDYGFDTFNIENLQTKGQIIGSVAINNPRLGDEPNVELYSNDEFNSLLSKDELAKISTTIKYNDDILITNTNNDISLKTPISKDTAVGTITYSLDGDVLFTGEVLAKSDALERSFKTDFNYYFSKIKSAMFSLKAIPFWIGAVIAIFIAIRITKNISRKRNRRRNTLSRRY